MKTEDKSLHPHRDNIQKFIEHPRGRPERRHDKLQEISDHRHTARQPHPAACQHRR